MEPGTKDKDKTEPGTEGKTAVAAGAIAFFASCGGCGWSDGSQVVPPPPAPAEIRLEQPFASLPAFDQPLALVQAPGDDSRWFVVERTGRVRVFDNDPAVSASSVVIDLSDAVDSGPTEAGLLGMAFHPDFQSNGQVFLSFTRPGLISYVSRFTSGDGGATLDPASEEVVLTLPQPFDNHNGGNVAFGPDGMLYAGFGDGGSGDDPQDHGQDTADILGAIVRVDVDGGSPYAIPPDNPFAGNPVCTQGFGQEACPEIFAYGLRNPWRWSFDADTGDLWVGDVGQDEWEEIDVVTSGGNYGWRIREGSHCHIPSDCDATGLIDPVAEYDHGEGEAVTGGYVYRGTAIAGLVGAYLYADFITGRIWALEDDGAGGRESRELLDPELGIASFGQANDGELYVVDFGGGLIYRIVAD
jgi:glucose/arabinose dehydrogenase